MYTWSCCWTRYVVVADCTMGIPSCGVVVYIGEVCVKLFMWRTKMNFWYVKFLTEFLVLLGESNLVKFLFSCCGCVSRVVWEKTGVLCENRLLTVLKNECLCEVLENYFGIVETWIFWLIMIELSVRSA